MRIGLTMLNDTLRDLEQVLGYEPGVLVTYAQEWDVGDCPTHKDKCPHIIDRKMLYALIRAEKPRHVLETGTDMGNGANVILAALKANGFGDLVTVDVLPDRGENILPEYDNVTILTEDVVDFVNNYQGEGFDFIHEDSSHEVHTVRVVYEFIDKLSPGGCVIISHDVGTGVKTAIRTGIKDAGLEPLPEFVPEGSLGYTAMRTKGNVT